MLFRSIATTAFLSQAFAFSPSTFNRPSTSALNVVSEPEASGELESINPLEGLVTKEANIKPTYRSNPTLDPFNPEFERIKSVAYSDAFPNSTKEHKTVEHKPTGHMLDIPFRRVHLEDEDMAHLDLYDTSGPRDINPRDGIPKVRKEWVDAREGNY
mmetsp:Transcript_23632/g.35094  ORF Transcript_23632/g.35094 Transcript_23632/m.35094 type:complete len:157 (-) Transcript_23632:899-1369(-)